MRQFIYIVPKRPSLGMECVWDNCFPLRFKRIDRSLFHYTNVVTRCIFGTRHQKEEIVETTHSFTPEKLIAIRGACNLYSDHRVVCFLSKHGHTILRVVENTFSRAKRAANRGRGPSKNSSKPLSPCYALLLNFIHLYCCKLLRGSYYVISDKKTRFFLFEYRHCN